MPTALPRQKASPEGRVIRFCLIALAAILLFAAGRSMLQQSTQSGPYRIIERRGSDRARYYAVEVPPGTSLTDLEKWAKEIHGWDRDGVSVMINFYDGPQGMPNFVASYEGGTVRVTGYGNPPPR